MIVTKVEKNSILYSVSCPKKQSNSLFKKIKVMYNYCYLYISQKHHFLPLLKPLLSKTLLPIVGLIAVSTPLDEFKRVFASFYLPDYDLKRLMFVDANSSIFGF